MICNMVEKSQGSWAENIIERFAPSPLEREVGLTVIIPTFNNSESIGRTLESVRRQNYPHLELIIIDAGSTDHTLEIAGSYAELISRVYTVTDFNLFEMVNRGIALASKRYLTILFPGSFYLSDGAYNIMAHAAGENNYPHLLYAGSIQSELRRSPRLVHFALDRETLRRGVHPATLPACWFRTDLFETLGKFSPSLTVRSSFELLCRIATRGDYRTAMVDRVLVEYHRGRFSYAKLLKYASDTWRILQTYFGFFAAAIWFLGVNHLNIVRWWLRSIERRTFKT